MNFTFLVILSLLTLGFTYETLKISQKRLCVIILVLLILLVSYNIKETFNTQTTSAVDASNSLVLSADIVSDELKSTYLEQADEVLTIRNQLLIEKIKDSEYLEELLEKLQNLQSTGKGFKIKKSHFPELVGFNNLLNVSDFIDTELPENLEVDKVMEWWFALIRETIDKRLDISYNQQLDNINAFNRLSNANGILVHSNNSLKTLTGFNSIKRANAVVICDNPKLESIDTFRNLEVINGGLYLFGNTYLKELTPFTELTTVTFELFLIDGIFSDENFDIDYYFPKLMTVGCFPGYMPCSIVDKFKTRPGFRELFPNLLGYPIDSYGNISPCMGSSNMSNNDNNSEDDDMFLFNTDEIKNVKNLFHGDVKKQVRNDRDIKSELLKLKIRLTE